MIYVAIKCKGKVRLKETWLKVDPQVIVQES